MYTKATAEENRIVTKRANTLVKAANYNPRQPESRRKQIIREVTTALSTEFPHISSERLVRRVTTAIRTKSNWSDY